MFDRCWLWRRRLSRRADGKLPLRQWGALQAHLALCPQCHEAAMADQALREVLHIHTGLPDAQATRALDDIVVASVVPIRVSLLAQRHAEPQRSNHHNWPLVYFVQIVGGGLTAAAITALFLVPALHPAADPSRPQSIPVGIERSNPPVPLESLLQTASPRAALLWTAPLPPVRRSNDPAPHVESTPAQQPVSSPVRRSLPANNRQRHSMLDDRQILGS
jgi:anti-sigma factor RsiW